MYDLTRIPDEYLERLPDFLKYPNPDVYLSDNFLVLDLETTVRGDDGSPSPVWPDNSIVCGSWAYADGPAHNIYGNEYEIGELIDAIADVDFVVAFNGKFDLAWLSRAGLDLHKVLLYDPMIGEYVRLGNRDAGKKGVLKLDTLAKRYIGRGKAHYVDLLMQSHVPTEDIPKSMLIERCDSDVLQTREVFKQQREELDGLGLLPVVFSRCIFSTPLADIELKGCVLDKERVEAEYQNGMAELITVNAEIDDFTGGINPNSPKQVAEFLYDVLKFPVPKKGKGRNAVEDRTTRTERVLQFTAKTKKQERFLELKKRHARHNADISKNLEYFHGVVTDDRYDVPVFFAQFNQTVTVTHRLSSSGIKRIFKHLLDGKGKPKKKSIQLQNSPRKYKKLYKARHEGWQMGEVDGAQLEFRVAAFLGQCVVAAQDIADSKDVHKQSASVINKCRESQVTGEMRTAAKADTFKPLFGGQSGTDDQKRYYKFFRDHYVGISSTQQRWIDSAVMRHKVTLPTGLSYYYPNAKITPTGYVTDTPSICNYPVQGFATADIIPIAVTYLWHFMYGMQSFLVNTVHDSAVAEIHPDEVEEYKEAGKIAFINAVYYYLKAVYDIEFNVPLGVGCKIGEHWGEGVEYKYSPPPPYALGNVDYTHLSYEWIED